MARIFVTLQSADGFLGAPSRRCRRDLHSGAPASWVSP